MSLTTGVYEFYRQNPFTQAYHRAVLAGQLLAVLISRARLFNANPVSLLGFSLGAVFAHAACLALHDLKSPPSLGDVCLLGACVDLLAFGQTLHKLIGSRGVVQGKLTVVFSSHDSVLAYLFRSARLGETPIGLKRPSEEFLMNCLRENDPTLATYSQDRLAMYLAAKFEVIDASAIIGGHLDYATRLADILPLVDFNGDFQAFGSPTSCSI